MVEIERRSSKAVADVRTDPIHQFGIQKIVDINIDGYDVSFTNSSLFMVLTLAAIALVLLWAVRLARWCPVGPRPSPRCATSSSPTR